MDWQQICETPFFKDIPYKIETNKWGKIQMSPASNEHGLYQALIIKWLSILAEKGQAISECSIQTSDGVKVEDVAWGSNAFFRKNKRDNPYMESPEIIVEILSPSNTVNEMDEKKELYFARGAQEFWLCEKSGAMKFFNNHKELERSTLIKNFPLIVKIDFE